MACTIVGVSISWAMSPGAPFPTSSIVAAVGCFLSLWLHKLPTQSKSESSFQTSGQASPGSAGSGEANSLNEPDGRSVSRYQVSVSGLVLYLSLWALIFGGIRFLQEYSSLGAEGAYTIAEGRILDFGLPILIGLVLVAVGIAVAYLAGSIRHAWRITWICFLVGWLSIPALWVAVVILHALGVIDLD